MSDLREAAVEAPQPRLEDATAAEPSPPPSDDDRPKAAVWAVNEPEGPWCQPGHVRALEGLLGPKDTALFVDNATNHTRATSAHAGAWRLLGATRRGRRHAHVGAWTDDALSVDIRGGRHVLAVADGAGSAQHLEPRHGGHRVGERARATAGGDVGEVRLGEGKQIGVPATAHAHRR
jgi:hypothetical protein